MLKCLKNELLLMKTKRHCFDVGSIAHNGRQVKEVKELI
jgi:hypothetical protein